ncbi:hypothetical protein PR003_g4457 [Phytophthora rubi]|uniref:Uncharacterized protein n=3 Tax=Phytophthora TaxID=4783 RepID=A0A6A3NQG4_9STRA|nr:hypothetical protein PR001_g5826 [Phytophthora rubi]KAE9352278.1 hypothetical protein PR003_g4457 [Phytophthora rubi]
MGDDWGQVGVRSLTHSKIYTTTPPSAQWKFVMSQRFCRLRETTLELTDNFRAYAMDIIGYAAVREVDSCRVLFTRAVAA